eukprot:5291405-Pleurochrysis_carterae.AAC.3
MNGAIVHPHATAQTSKTERAVAPGARHGRRGRFSVQMKELLKGRKGEREGEHGRSWQELGTERSRQRQ